MVTDDTLNKEDVLMIFDVLKVQNWPLKIWFLRRQFFLKISVSPVASSRQSVSYLRYTSWTTDHVD